MNKIFLLGFLLIVSSFSFLALYADSNGVWHYVKDIRPGTFGQDEYSGTYIFNDQIEFNDQAEFNQDVYYKGDELDSRYVLEDQPNSIKSAMIVDDTIQGSDLTPIYEDGSVYDPRFVNADGDIMSGKLTVNHDIQANNIVANSKITANEFCTPAGCLSVSGFTGGGTGGGTGGTTGVLPTCSDGSLLLYNSGAWECSSTKDLIDIPVPAGQPSIMAKFKYEGTSIAQWNDIVDTVGNYAPWDNLRKPGADGTSWLEKCTHEAGQDHIIPGTDWFLINSYLDGCAGWICNYHAYVTEGITDSGVIAQIDYCGKVGDPTCTAEHWGITCMY